MEVNMQKWIKLIKMLIWHREDMIVISKSERQGQLIIGENIPIKTAKALLFGSLKAIEEID